MDEARVEPDREAKPYWIESVARSGVIIDAADYYSALADAIETAERYVLLMGWQLESSVWLRRRPEDEGRARTLAEVIRNAVDRNPELHFYVNAWDWATVYAMDREWQTDRKLLEAARGRLTFVHDKMHAPGASQHSKLTLVDGHTAWVGGIDVCEHRWDERSHLEKNPMRFDGKMVEYGPYHDVVSVLRGNAVRPLVDYFVDRWVDAGGQELVLVPAPEPELPPFSHIYLGETPVEISRTRGAMAVPLREPIDEVRRTYVDAIRRAEQLIYIETQYITSRALFEAIVARMREVRGSALEVVIIVPRCLTGRLEKVAIDVPQKVGLNALVQVAKERGHRIGIYSPCVPSGDEDGRCETYVHSKLMIVDDQFLTVGSANATNRSMGLDSELNVSFRVGPKSSPDLGAAIRRVRTALLAEHAGIDLGSDGAIEGKLARLDGLVDLLDEFARTDTRLSPFEIDDTIEGPLDELLASFGDPEQAAIGESVFEEIMERPSGVVAALVNAVHGT